MHTNFLKNSAIKVFHAVKAHKIWTAVILAAVLWLGYFSYGKIFPTPTVTKYVLGTVERGALISSVSGSGQVSAFHQLDLKPKVSGNITYVGVQDGDAVKTGAVIAEIDSTDALKTVRDAEANLVSAQISLQKTELQSAQSVDQSNTDLKKAYDDGFTDVANTFIDLPSLISDTGDILYNTNHSPYMDNGKIQQAVGQAEVDSKYKIAAQFEAAKVLYNKNLSDYKAANRNSDPATIEKLVTETQTTTKALGDAIKNINNLIDYISVGLNQKSSAMTTDQATLGSYISKTDSDLSSLTSAESSITSAKNSVASASQSFQAGSGLDNSLPIDVQSAELAVTQKQNALLDAKESLADYTIRAPFDGVIANVSVKKADPASSATAVATIVSKDQVATLTLNEIDAANVKVGQKATLTFDALPDLTMTGSVISVDSIGTVTQGVVNYTIQIGMDTQNDQIKPGMSVSATIITNTKLDVLLVPNSAIKSSGAASTVQVLAGQFDASAQTTGVVSAVPPETVTVEIGDSNDTDTEIISGLNEGDQVVVRTITGAQAQTSTPAAATTRTSAGGLFGTSGGAAAARIGR